MDKYKCKICGAAGKKTLLPYKIIYDKDGESIKFVAQLCERCYKELFESKNESAQNTKTNTEKEITTNEH